MLNKAHPIPTEYGRMPWRDRPNVYSYLCSEFLLSLYLSVLDGAWFHFLCLVSPQGNCKGCACPDAQWAWAPHVFVGECLL